MTAGVRIGLEVHVQLATVTKLFCSCRATFGAAPNTHVCPVCLGLPGALPATNAHAVRLAVRTALALDAEVRAASRFARKGYFYPDLPRGYQITQWREPLATGGALDLPSSADDPAQRVRFSRLHLEEDAGRLLHEQYADRTAVDLNRAGVPLLEIVTEPDLHTPRSARAFLTRLRQTLLYLEVSDCDMSAGSLRVDANVSVAATDQPAVRTEIKNLNTFAGLERALEYEIERQRTARRDGRDVEPATLAWDERAGRARTMRAKEAHADYRYADEPDLPPVTASPAMIEEERSRLPELPAWREQRFRTQWHLPPEDAAALAADRRLADYFEAVARRVADPKAAANWVMVDVLAWLGRHGADIASFPVTPAALAGLIGQVRSGTVSSSGARRALRLMAETGRSAADVIAAYDLAQVGDTSRLADWIDRVIAQNPGAVDRYRTGSTRVLEYLMGRIMKESRGRADPVRAAALLRERLEP